MNDDSRASLPPSTAPPDWGGIAASEDLQRLLAAKRQFVRPVFALFVAFYMALHLAMGLAPRFMSTPVGAVSVGYCFALLQFVSGGAVAILYLRFSAKQDAAVQALLRKHLPTQERAR